MQPDLPKNTMDPTIVSSEDEIDLGELLDILTDNKKLIVVITFIACVTGIAFAYLSKPIFRADGLLQIKENSPSMIEQLDLLTSFIESKTPVQAEIELIKSRMILGKTIENLHLDVIATPRFFPLVGNSVARLLQRFNEGDSLSMPLLGFSQYAWGGEAIQVDTLEVPASWKNEVIVLQATGKNQYRLIYQDEIILEGEVGKLAIKKPEGYSEPIKIFIANLKARPETLFTLIRRSEGEAIQGLKAALSVTEVGKNTGILELSMESEKPEEAVRIINEIANTYLQQNVEQKSAESQKTLEFLEKQLPALKEQLETAINVLNNYRIRKGSINLDLETQNILTSTVELSTQVTLLQQKRDELRQKFTESHPSIVAIDKQIGRLQAQINALDKKIGVLPETQQIILRLSRDVEVNSELYTTLLNHAQTIRVAKAGTVGNVRIVDYAIPPELPVKPKKMLVMAIALMAGLLLGVIAAFARRSLNRGIKDPNIIERVLNIPVYTTIQHSQTQKLLEKKLKGKSKPDNHFPLLALEDPEDLAVESLRSLRTTLHFAFLEASNNIIMITGPSPGIGKTFVAANLATVMAIAGKKILLIDGDLRRGTLHKYLCQDRDNGLSELISQAIDLDEVIKPILQANIDFVSTGKIPPNPSELLLHERFEHFLETASKRYDLIIIDSPPILAATDAAIIGRLASVSLMVVKAETHPERELEQSAKKLVQAGVNLKGVIFNDMPGTLLNQRYGQYVYQYDYRRKE